jgi:hypothetical protein
MTLHPSLNRCHIPKDKMNIIIATPATTTANDI